MTFSDGAAVVLGPGGLVGTAWLLGLAAGLRRGGVDLADADLIVGTSAGAIAGAVLATGGDPERLSALPDPSPDPTAPRTRPDRGPMGEVFAILADQADPERVRRVGRIALTAPTIPEDVHVARMAWLIGAHDWPDRRLLITAVDVETGRPVVWDRGSGVPLASAVAASCAMPAAYPPVTIEGRRYMDGALGGGSNIHLADGADPVVVIEPGAPRPGPAVPAAVSPVAVAVRPAPAVVRIAPDEAARNSFGPDLGDRSRWWPVYQAGLNQARTAAGLIRR
ncbi:patatin-like phospholipase family protein [Frankia sp. Mgl5]|uniref:patatin-like phospholipase family protein n=1 Tax=Frankia sp. Mgl5 TaxID=2933793 RepID=UPI00200EE72D|nr:patatin-like phospholipase family protein [Frankia sp. Mgl5]MCK9932177.1 patatin-like phospholipase family protein [Frankia sp. Mgl5]